MFNNEFPYGYGEYGDHSRRPYYNDESDYNTNAPSYYDDISRKQRLIQYLAEKIGNYDIELEKRFKEWDELISKFPDNVEKLLIEWLEDGTLDKIINENIFNMKLDKDVFEKFRDIITDNLDHVKFYEVPNKNETIKETISLLNTGNRKIAWIPSGDYEVDDTLLISSDNVKIELSKNAVIKANFIDKPVFKITGDNVEIKGGIIERPNQHNGINTKWHDEETIIITYGDYTVIDGVTFNNIYRVGIGARNVKGLKVINSIFNGNYPGIPKIGDTLHFAITTDQSSYGIFKDNYFYDCIQGIFFGSYGIEKGHNNLVTNNMFNQMFDHDVYSGNLTEHTNITNNISINSHKPFVVTGKGHIVTGNTVFSDGNGKYKEFGELISVRDPDHVIVSNNNIDSFKQWAAPINVQSLGGNVINNVLITNNTLKYNGNSPGIRVVNGKDEPISRGVVITDNFVTGGIQESLGMITLSSGNKNNRGKGNVIRNNILTVTQINNTVFGVMVQNERDVIVENNKIVNDVIGTGGLSSLRGIQLYNVKNIDINNNEYIVNPSKGYEMSNLFVYQKDSTGVLFRHNKVVKDDTSPIIVGFNFENISEVEMIQNKFSNDKFNGKIVLPAGERSIKVENKNLIFCGVTVTPTNQAASKYPFFLTILNNHFVITLNQTPEEECTFRYDIQ